jgi:hypothetical protein
VPLYRTPTDHERLRHCGIGAPFGHQPQHFTLARQQQCERVRAPPAAEQNAVIEAR